MGNSLCCSVNPVDKCRDCGKGVCKEHNGGSGKRFNSMYWCEECFTDKKDYIDLIEDLTTRLDDSVAEFMSVFDEWDNVASHAARCRDCRGELPCGDLFGLIDAAASRAGVSLRRVRKLNQ